MNLIKILAEALMSPDGFVFKIVEKDYPLSKRLQRAKILSQTEIVCEEREIVMKMPCSIETWNSLTNQQQRDFISAGMESLKKDFNNRLVLAHFKGVNVAGRTTGGNLIPAYTDRRVSKILIEDKFVSFHELVMENAGTFHVDYDYETGLNVKMSVVE